MRFFFVLVEYFPIFARFLWESSTQLNFLCKKDNVRS